MPENKAPLQGDLLEALDALTGLIADREQRTGFSAFDGDEEPDLEGFDFGPATDDDGPIPLLQEVVQSPEPELPSPGQLEALMDQILDRRLAALREELKREIFIELRKRYPEL